MVILDEPLRSDIEAIKRLPISFARDVEQDKQISAMGAGVDVSNTIPLSEVAEVKIIQGPNQISRENGKRRIYVTANVRDRDLGTFVQDVQDAVSGSVEIPAGYWVDYGGTFEQLISASKRFSYIIPLTLLVIFILLVMAFNSLRDAALVLPAYLWH